MIAQCNGTLVSYDDTGNGSAVVFIHGHPFNRTMWEPQMQQISRQYRVIAPDLRGYGQSAKVTQDAVTLETYAQDLAALLEHLNVDSACIVGLSMGGQIAMEFARAYPQRVNGLVLAATFARAETKEGVAIRHRTADSILEHGMALHGCELLPKLIGKTSMKRSPMIAAKVYGMIASTDPQGAAAALRGRAQRRDYTEFLGTVRAASLIVVGTEDPFTDALEAAKLQQRMPSATLEVFEHIGHMPNLEDAQRFNRVLFSFLETVYGRYVVR